MPLPLLFALFLAFGLELPSRLGPVPRSELDARLAMTAGVIGLVALAALALGRWVAARVGRRGFAGARLRRGYAWGARLIEVATLAGYGAIVHRLEWPWLVRWGFGLRGVVVLEDAAILLPFVLMQVAAWWGLYPAERALRSGLSTSLRVGPGRYLALRARQTLGLVLPVLLIFSLGQDLARRLWPAWSASEWSQPAEVAAMGALILVLSPVFVRLAWPTRPMPPGPLRDRLEHLARRLGFRCSDILIWDTGQVVANACVTGSLPWFRYVLLTDALIEYLDDHQVAAVFGHEIGHIAHRHLAFFGFFFAGSLAVLALLSQAIDEHAPALSAVLDAARYPILTAVVEAAAVLVVIGLYVAVVFGYLSRRFERQADVFGCLAVSCGQADCPPHADLDRSGDRRSVTAVPCPVGIRIFASALAHVAALNGIEPRSRSWRHGSIARRIAFVEGLEGGGPSALRRFQSGISRMRMAVALGLIAAVLAALATGAAEHLR